MRYLHRHVGGIVRYVEASGLIVSKCHRQGVTAIPKVPRRGGYPALIETRHRCSSG